ncbi:MAG TPA: hypothetical protein VGI16_10600 [Candidatus Acidoferrum sp.]
MIGKTIRVTLLAASALFVALAAFAPAATATRGAAADKTTWKTVQFAIVRFNDDAPRTWNIYHSEKRGVLLVHLWKRYMLIKVQDQEVFDIDPEKVKVVGDTAEWSTADVPHDPIETSEWKVRDVGPVERIRFRFGKTGHFLDIQLPMQINGKPVY